jgi:hypothetical protein
MAGEEAGARRELEGAARVCALRLLDLSEVYDDVTVPAATSRDWLVVVALTARQRRHMQAVIALADRELFIEAEIVVRTMFEFFIRQKWLLLDPSLHRLLWLRDEITRRFTIDREAREWAQANNETLEILTPEGRELFERQLAEINEQLDAIVAARGLDARPRYPSLIDQAVATDDMIDYTLTYRIDSQSAAHPSAMAIQNLMLQLPDDAIQIRNEPPPGKRLNVYAAGALRLHHALAMTGHVIPQLRLDDLDEILAKLAELGRQTRGLGGEAAPENS